MTTSRNIGASASCFLLTTKSMCMANLNGRKVLCLPPEITSKIWWLAATRKSSWDYWIKHYEWQKGKSFVINVAEKIPLVHVFIDERREELLWMIIATSNCCKYDLVTILVVNNTKKGIEDEASLRCSNVAKSFLKEEFWRRDFSSGTEFVKNPLDLYFWAVAQKQRHLQKPKTIG